MPRKRDCIAKKMYDILTPYVQVVAWVILVANIYISSDQIIKTVEAFDGRIAANTQAIEENKKAINELSRVDDKLNTVINILRGGKDD